ncbi:MAG: hypothetical protein EP312_03845, partial [Gammaproteobacteria bacterium]
MIPVTAMQRLLILLLLGCGLAHAATPPNIIIFLVDDMGWDDPAFMGNAWHETPAMDQLAAEGMVFTQAYSSAPNCKPSRASLLTGLYPVHHGIYSALPPNTPRMHRQRLIAPDTHFQLQRGTTTIASLLKQRGYRTALIGKWDLGFDNTAPEAFGFDHAVGWFRGGYLENGFFAPYGLPGLETAPEGEYLTTRLGEESVRFIESSSTDNNGQPFFLMLSHYAVHVPLQAPKEMVMAFRNKPRPGDGYNATYAAMLKSVDQTLARIIATLDTQGLRDNTIIILTSDNGAMAELAQPSALRGSKGSLDEGGIRIPLVWSGPGSIAGKNAVPISHIDILPTLMAQLGERIPVDGIDATSCLTNEACVLDRDLYWHFPAY